MTYHNAAAILADPATAVVERAPLTRAFDLVNQAVGPRNTLPILSNARMTGDGSSLWITGTDLDLELTVSIPAAADSRFAVTLPARKMRDLLKKATASDFVAFTMPEEDSGSATVDFERVKYRLQSLPVTDFPTLRGPTPLCPDLVTVDSSYRSFRMTGAAFWQAIDATMGAMSTEGTRYYLNGIFMHIAHDGALRLVATDGHRLYRQDLPAPAGSEAMPDIIIPRGTVTLLHKILKGKACPETIEIEVTDTSARFTWGDPGFYVSLQSKLIDGAFPAYERVIPSNFDRSARFDPESMLEAIHSVSLIRSERGRAVKMTMDRDRIQLYVNNPDEGSAQADVAADCNGADGFEIGFNTSYLTDIIATASPDGAVVRWRGTDSGAPSTFTGSRHGWMAVLMPMRI